MSVCIPQITVLLSNLFGLGRMACSNSELHFSERFASMIFGRTPLMSDQPIARPLPTQDNTTP
jgi:hypothetical protein